MRLAMPAVVTCPECRSPLRLPEATPEGRVRCPKCKAVFAPIVDAEVDLSESVAVLLDEPKDSDKSFFERVAGADDPFSPPPAQPFEEVVDAEVAEQPEPAKTRRTRKPEPEPVRTGNGLAIALVALIGLMLLGGVAGASYVAYRLLSKDRGPAPETIVDLKQEKPADASIPPDAMAKVKAATVLVRTQYPDGQATTSAGFFVRGPGLILTNARSVGQGSKKMPALKVIATCGTRTLAARILAADADLDLALLQVAGLDLPEPLPLDADTFTVREPMPLVVFSASEGRIVTTNVNVSGTKTVAGTRPWFLLGGTLPQGAWGGPVTDATGKVIGVSGVVGNGDPAVVPAESAWSFVQTAAKSAESTGGIAFASLDSGKKTRDEWDDGNLPGVMPNPWRQGRPQFVPPGWDQPPFAVPPQILPPGIDPNFPRPRERR
jgi:hypothetical protein